MAEVTPDRRRHTRASASGDFRVLVDERSYPAEFFDLSPAGMQARVDPMVFDEIREKINAVRFGDHPPLAVTVHWGFFDGNFGVSFIDRLDAGPIVEKVLAALPE